MRAVVQRVQKASVNVSGEVVSSIGQGLCVLIGIRKNDGPSDIEYMVRKILNLRIFDDDTGKRWQKSVKDLNFEILCVSQFTLYGVLKGNKPDYRLSMGGDEAKIFYENFLASLEKQYYSEKIKDGVFGAKMNVELVNDGPVTISLESPPSSSEDSVDKSESDL